MDQKPPVRKNTFVIVAAVLFNLLWIALLFLSCQADNDSSPTPTPEAGIENYPTWDIAEALGLDAADGKDIQIWWMGDPVPGAHQHPFKFVSVFRDYSVPLDKPPSTCNITPVI